MKRIRSARSARALALVLLVILIGAACSQVISAPPLAAAVVTYPIVDTGQTKCYNNSVEIACPAVGAAFYGQDAQTAGAAASYTLSAAGLTVTDNVTGLTWQRSPDTNGDGSIKASDKLTWTQAQARPAALNAARYGGFSDWRLPTIKELYSLIDFRGTDPSVGGTDTSDLTPFINTAYFKFAYGDTGAGERVIDAQYASSTLYAASSTKLFGVNFADGRIKGYDLTMPGGAAKTFFVICVRGNTGYGSNSFANNGDGTVSDNAAGLNWEQALAWVQQKNAANYLGHNDWRLPNAKELQSIVDYTRSPGTTGSAAINAIFSATRITNEAGQNDYPSYWTSTTHASSNGSGAAAVYVAFGRALGYMNGAWVDVHGAGAQRSDPKSGNPADYPTGRGPQGDAIRIYNYVRLVRSASSIPPATAIATNTATVTSTRTSAATATPTRTPAATSTPTRPAAPTATPTQPGPPPPPPIGGGMTITQTLSDEGQRNTIAFDGLAFLTGNLGADSFFPPGKVADFWGFQYLRDNDPSGMGHNTDFLTKASLNLLHVLTTSQRAALITLAQGQVAAIQQYATDRFALMDVFRRLLTGNVPAGSTGLDAAAVKAYSAQLYRLDGEISYQRAQVMGTMISSFTAEQRAYLDALKGQGMTSWPDVAEPDELRGLERAVKEAVMTYAGDMFSWYVGSVEADVYFCPERQGTYFGSFYMKDAPAVGNPGYSIPVTMTAEMGATFLRDLTPDQATLVTDLVEAQKPALYAIVDRRQEVATQLRRFMTGATPDQAQVLALMEAYGALDGEIITRYAAAFAQIGQGLSTDQRTQLTALRTQILGSLSLPTGAFLYSTPISMPTIPNTDFLFASGTAPSATATPTATATRTATATPTRTSTPTQAPPTATPTRTQGVGVDSVTPNFAAQGQPGVLVTINLTAASAPPAGVMPSNVKIGSLTGRKVMRAGLAVTAVFDIPPTEPIGWKDVTVTFPAPGGTAVFAKPGGFEVRKGAGPRVTLPLVVQDR